MNSVASLPAWLEKAGQADASLSLPQWAVDLRQQQWEAFVKNGLPTRRDERWKYADLSFLTNKPFSTAPTIEADRFLDVINQHRLQRGESILLVFINGYFQPTLSDLAKLPKDVIACSMMTAMQQQADLVKAHWLSPSDARHYPFVSLNTALSLDGLFFYLPKACELTAPIHLLSLIVGKEAFVACPQHLFLLGEQSKLTLVEEYFSFTEQAYMMNVVTQMVAEKEAQLDYYKIQSEGKQATHLAHTLVQQKQNSQINFTHFSSGGLFARDEIIVTLQESGANCRTGGFYHLRDDNQYVDYHLDINHAAPHSQSEMLYKGIIDKKARAVFNGRLHVEKGAQKILAYQANHNLLLSKEAEVYSKPELEIYADDVKCKHGASTGQIDQEAIFYLRSRGIDKDEAIGIWLQGFAEEILQRVTHAGIKMRAEEIVL